LVFGFSLLRLSLLVIFNSRHNSLYFRAILLFLFYLFRHFVDVDTNSSKRAVALQKSFAYLGFIFVVFLLKVHVSVVIPTGCS